MPVDNYSVFLGKVDEFHAERDDDESPHFQLFLTNNGERIRAPINVKSRVAPSQLAFHINRNFSHPITERLINMEGGFTELPPAQRGGLDYLRSSLFNLEDVEALPHDAPGVEDDLQDIVLSLCRSAKASDADVYVFGEPFRGGIHNIHMNQGNSGGFSKDNGIFQDGGVLFHFSNPDRWAALFLAFQSQAIQTDKNGAPINGSPLFAQIIRGGDIDNTGTTIPPLGETGGVRIISALVNPIGSENQPDHQGPKESVTLINITPERKLLNNWTIETSSGKGILNELSIETGETVKIVLAGNPPLGNKGGTITLFDSNNLRVHSVSYTKTDANKEGWSIIF